MAGRYVNEDAVESERPMKVCAEAGRKCVRNIHQYPVLSVEWIALVDNLKQLARLVQLEGKMPANSKIGDTAGRDKESEGTLWDQEVHENAIRILVEEAKVNLCLRMMNDYKAWQYDDAQKRATTEECLKAYEYNENQLEQKCTQFEECLGMLLKKAFMHVETLQLMDIPLLIDHCVFILDKSREMPSERVCDSRLQETVVLYYFSSLMKHAEALSSSQLLARAREVDLVSKAVDHLLMHIEQLPAELKLSVAEGLAAMSDNEDFQTEWQYYFPSGTDAFLQLEDHLSNPILAEKPDMRRVLRPLLDMYNTMKRAR